MKLSHLHVEEWILVRAACCLRASTQRAAAQLGSAMQSSHSAHGEHPCRRLSSVPSTGFTLSLPPSHTQPPCVFCTQAVGRQGQSPWGNCTGCVVPSLPLCRRMIRGQAPCGQEEVEGVLFLTGDTTQCL